MKVKLQTIICSVVVGIILLTTILLANFIYDSGLKLSEPATINLYKNTSVATSITKSQNENKFNDLWNSYKNMTVFSYLDILTNGYPVKEEPSQNISGNLSWSFTNTTYYYIEFIFAEKQVKTITVSGATKRVEFYSIIFQVPENSKMTKINIYFSESADKTYNINGFSKPFIVRARTKNLYNVMKNI